MSSEKPILQFNRATVYRNETKVMDDFSMCINRLEHTAIVGPNGAGKSTFIQLLTHQLHPVASKNGTPTIRIFEKDHWNVAELQKKIGIVSSSLEHEIANNLKKGRLSGRDVVLSGFFSSMELFAHHVIDDGMRAKADEALRSIKALYLADHLFNRMSAGEARRVLIARALVTSPDMLVLDEPTTALDFVARKTCLRLIRSIAREGTTIVIVTHQVEEVIPEIKKVVLLKKGVATFNGPKEQVLNSQNLSTVFDHPLKLHREHGTYRIGHDCS